MSQETKNGFILTHSSQIVQALLGLKGVGVLRYRRSGSDVEFMIEQVVGEVRCPICAGRAQVKDRPVGGDELVPKSPSLF